MGTYRLTAPKLERAVESAGDGLGGKQVPTGHQDGHGEEWRSCKDIHTSDHWLLGAIVRVLKRFGLEYDLIARTLLMDLGLEKQLAFAACNALSDGEGQIGIDKCPQVR